MLPFDRFVQAIDNWALANPDQPVFIQIGAGTYEPQYAQFSRFVPMAEYRQRLVECDLFVAHVGMGSILQALEARKQMVLLPRDFSRGEHTTDHQMHTAARFADRSGMKIVSSTEELALTMSKLLREPLVTESTFSTRASPELLSAVSAYLAGGTPSSADEPVQR
jgi:UDP-N-acetylglucosamine transferase subunit ALG13